MSSITTINGTDVISTSRSTINTNFANLNSDKIETSYLDTDTALTANSDAKIATQKAVKAYVDSGGQQNASETVRGLVEEATDAEITAGTDTGATGAKLFAPPSKMNTQIDAKVAAATPDLSKVIGVGNSSNTTYINYQIPFAYAAGTFGWTSVGSPTYAGNFLITGSAQGVQNATFLKDIATAADMTYANTKKKILEWTAKIAADTTTGTSNMGFAELAGTYGNNNRAISFCTDTNGAWYTIVASGTARTETAISTPSVGVHTFRIEWDANTPAARFYIDGTLVDTRTTTNLPISANAIQVVFTNGTTSTIIGALSAINVAVEK